MGSFEDFDEDDWLEMFAELRLLVVNAGFMDWDASTVASLDEEEEGDASSRWQLIRYLKSFSTFLSVRSEENLDRMRGELEELVQTDRELPVRDVIVRDRDDAMGVSVLEGPSSDGLIDELRKFLNALREDTGYFDNPEFQE